MIPKHHIIIGALATIIIYLTLPITNLQAIIIFLSSFLIDIDHYLIYVLTKKDLSQKNARRFFHKGRTAWLKLSTTEQARYKRHIYIFLLSIYYSYFFICKIILD